MQGAYYQQQQGQESVYTYQQQLVFSNNPQQVHLAESNVKNPMTLKYHLCLIFCQIGEASNIGFVKAFFGVQKFICFISLFLNGGLAYLYHNNSFSSNEKESNNIEEMRKTALMVNLIAAGANLLGLIFSFIPTMANYRPTSINITQCFFFFFNLVHFIFLLIYSLALFLFPLIESIILSRFDKVFFYILGLSITFILLLGLTLGQLGAQCEMFSVAKKIRENEAERGMIGNNISVNYE